MNFCRFTLNLEKPLKRIHFCHQNVLVVSQSGALLPIGGLLELWRFKFAINTSIIYLNFVKKAITGKKGTSKSKT